MSLAEVKMLVRLNVCRLSACKCVNVYYGSFMVGEPIYCDLAQSAAIPDSISTE